jgi:hypothetical protein
MGRTACTDPQCLYSNKDVACTSCKHTELKKDEISFQKFFLLKWRVKIILSLKTTTGIKVFILIFVSKLYISA